MNDTLKRTFLYGSGAVLTLGFIYAGFIYPKTVSADPGTLLSIAELNIGFAERLNSAGAGEKIHRFREERLREAEKRLDQVEKVAPGLAITREMRGFADWVREDFKGAEHWYRETLHVCQDDKAMVSKTRMNLSEILVIRKKGEEALQVLKKVGKDDRTTRWFLVNARAHHLLGETKAREASWDAALKKAGSDIEKKKYCGDVVSEWNRDKALSCYQSISKKDVYTFYRISSLKISGGEPDSAGDALRRAASLNKSILALLIRRDRAFWDKWDKEGMWKGILQGGAEGNAKADPSVNPGR
jgi:hypothetical protein